MAVLDRKRESVTSKPLRRRELAGVELDQRQVRHSDRGRGKAPRHRERARFGERCTRLLVATLEEERLPQRHESGVSPRTPVGLLLEHEPGATLGFGDPPCQEQRSDHRDRGAKRRDPVRERAAVRSGVGDVQPLLDLVPSSPAHPRDERAGDRELRVGLGARPRERLEPARHGSSATDGQQWNGGPCHERAGPIDVPALDRMLDCLLDVPVLLVPLRCSRVEPRNCCGIGRFELSPQHLREELVVAVLGAGLVEPGEEEVQPRDLLEHRCGPRRLEDGVADIRRQGLEH